LKSQNATSRSRGGRRYSPYAFTEHAAIMAANVLNSKQAVQMKRVRRAGIREAARSISTHKELAKS